jgi:hypothetical protein
MNGNNFWQNKQNFLNTPEPPKNKKGEGNTPFTLL